MSHLKTIVLYDTPQNRVRTYPMTMLRAVGDLLLGSFTLKDWWAKILAQPVVLLSEAYLSLPLIPANENGYICIDASVLPDERLVEMLLALKDGEMLEDGNGLLAYESKTLPKYAEFPIWPGEIKHLETVVRRVNHLFDLVKWNSEAIVAQYKYWQKSNDFVGVGNIVIGSDLVVGQNVTANACTLNTTTGPIIIGNNVTIMEGVNLRGPLVIMDGAVVKMGAKIYGGTTLGKNTMVGGEIKNSIVMHYSNKAHDGYLGDAYIGQWCNFGAGTSNSNVKNTGSSVKLWHEESKSYEYVGNKAGLIMGDHSLSAINTSFNTGTTLGIFCNVFGEGYANKHVESFNWGGFERYQLTDALNHAQKWIAFKGETLTENYKAIITHIYNK